MKQILIALLLAFTTSTVINAQKQSSIEKDSTENAKVTLSKKTDTKADESNTTVTVIGVDTTDMIQRRVRTQTVSAPPEAATEKLVLPSNRTTTTFPSATSATRSAEGS